MNFDINNLTKRGQLVMKGVEKLSDNKKICKVISCNLLTFNHGFCGNHLKLYNKLIKNTEYNIEGLLYNLNNNDTGNLFFYYTSKTKFYQSTLKQCDDKINKIVFDLSL